MKAEDLILNDSCKWQVVEKFNEHLPNVRISVLSQTFIIKSIDLSGGSRLMITSKDGDSLWISNLKCYQKRYGLNRVVTTVYIVTHE